MHVWHVPIKVIQLEFEKVQKFPAIVFVSKYVHNTQHTIPLEKLYSF